MRGPLTAQSWKSAKSFMGAQHAQSSVAYQANLPDRAINRYLPLRYFIAYILITLILFAVLPVQFTNMRYDILLPFMAAFLCIFILGFGIDAKGKDEDYHTGNYFEHFTIQLLGVFIAISLLLYIWAMAERATVFPFSLTTASLQDLGYTYRTSLTIIRQGDLPVLLSVQLLTLLSPITKTAMILGIYYFRKLHPPLKLLWVLTILAFLLNTLLFFGRQKDIGDLVIYAFSVAMIRDAKYGTKMKRHLVLIGIFLVVPLFVYMQYSRIVIYGSELGTNTLMTIDYDNPLFEVFGYDIGRAILLLGLYPAIGYYGLTLCLQLPFRWTYGIGNSFALMSYAEQYFGISPPLYYTYPLRMEAATGWPAVHYWNTIFPWLASDFTFVGSLLLMGLIAFVYSRTWREALSYDNPLSILVFSHLNILLLFVPANNQLMQLRESAIGWLVILILWIVFHRKLNRSIDTPASVTTVRQRPVRIPVGR